MKHLLLGRSGLRVSELCLGTLTFGETKAWGADREEAGAILRGFADAGGSFIDTAPNYAGGAAEEIVGGFLGGQRDDFVVATKYTAAAARHPLAGGNSRKSLIRSVEGSLSRLGTDHIDLLWLHYWDGTTGLDEILRALDDLVRAGKILYVGLSDTPAWLVSRAVTMADLRGWAPVIATQLEYNVAARSAERDLLPMAEALDLGVVCWGPLAAGALAGSVAPRRTGQLAPGAPLAASIAAIDALAGQSGHPASAWALQWIKRNPRHIPLVGARTAGQLAAILEAVRDPVDAGLLATLDEAAPVDPGFPYPLIASPYLRKLALGDPERLLPPATPRC